MDLNVDLQMRYTVQIKKKKKEKEEEHVEGYADGAERA